MNGRADAVLTAMKEPMGTLFLIGSRMGLAPRMPMRATTWVYRFGFNDRFFD
jgi:hypothetical protein